LNTDESIHALVPSGSHGEYIDFQNVFCQGGLFCYFLWIVAGLATSVVRLDLWGKTDGRRIIMPFYTYS